jgi:hypothetical protein
MVRHWPSFVVHGHSAVSIEKKTVTKAKIITTMHVSRPEVPQSCGSKPRPHRNMGGSMGLSITAQAGA